MTIPEPLTTLFRKIEENQAKYIANLKEAVAIKSVSGWPQNRPEIQKMINWIATKLRSLGATVQIHDIGVQKLLSGLEVPLPPVILASLGSDPLKKTVVVYSHLDVQPALVSDGWNTDPFTLTEKDGKLYGRGSSDDKGPALSWIHLIEAYQAIGQEIPVNLKFVFEGMEESGSIGVEDFLYTQTDKFLKGTDYVCVTDNCWLGNNKPCVTYGLRGMCYFELQVKCTNKDLHSGTNGGNVRESMTDLIYLLGSLINKDGKILIPGINNDITPLTEAEENLYKNIDFNVDNYKSEIGANDLLQEDKKAILMHRWRYPSLSIHGIEGAFSDSGQKGVIPAKVTGKFSIRTVPNQVGSKVAKLVIDYINQKWKEYGSSNEMKINLAHTGDPWISDPFDAYYKTGTNANKYVYGVEPDFTREGGSIPITLVLEKATGKKVILLPIGRGDDGGHSQNEKIDISNYINGTKVLGAYLYEVSKL